jgi:hypothetical protein
MLHTLTIATVSRSCRLLMAAWGSLVLISALAGESSIASESTGQVENVHSDASSDASAEVKGAGSLPHEQRTLAELWQAYTKMSPQLLLVIEILKKRGWADDKIADFLANPYPVDGGEGQRSGFGQSTMALTDPNFEPTYPVLNDSRPSYLRVGRAKTLTCNSVSILAPVRSISRAESAAAMSSQTELLLLCHMVRSEAEFFASYVQNFRAMQTLQSLRGIKDSSREEKGKLTIDQFERLKAMQAEYKSSRAMLVARIGEKAALKFDDQLQIGSSSPSSKPSEKK